MCRCRINSADAGILMVCHLPLNQVLARRLTLIYTYRGLIGIPVGTIIMNLVDPKEMYKK